MSSAPPSTTSASEILLPTPLTASLPLPTSNIASSSVVATPTIAENPTPSFAPPPSFFSHPALSLSNIKSHVPEILDYTNYLLWRELFMPLFTAYQVLSHVDGTPPPDSSSIEYSQWLQIDSLVLSWIQSTVSRDVLQSIITPGTRMTARMGLGPEYNAITSILSTLQPPPSFDQMKSILFLEESKLQTQQKPISPSPEQLLIAQQSGHQKLPPHGRGNGGRGNSGCGRGGRSHNSGGRNNYRYRPQQQPFYPMQQGHFQLPPSFQSAPSILGPAPGPRSPSPTGLMLSDFQREITCFRCGGLGHMQRECSSVLKQDTATPQAFNVYPAADANTQQWIFDFGASTHMTHDAGSTVESNLSQVP